MNIKYCVFAVGLVIGLVVFAADHNGVAIVLLKSRQEKGEMRKRADVDLENDLKKNRSLLGSGHENHGLIRILRVELARRGDKDERERIFTAMRSTDLLEQAQALDDAAVLGDYEAVYHLAEMLSDPTPGGRISYIASDGTVRKSTDQSVDAPSLAAAMKLAELIENPPVPPIGQDKKFYTEKDVLIWQEWWQENKSKIGNGSVP